MSHDERIARLTELARRVWPDRPLELRCTEVHPLVNGNAWEIVEDGGDGDEVCYLRVSADRPLDLDALEAALLVLNGTRIHVMVPPTRGYVPWHVQDEPPAWVEELAREWEQTAAKWRGDHEHYDGEEECEPSCNAEAKQVERCAAELRKRAKEMGHG